MARFKILVEYDGRNFCGWQVQNQSALPSVAGVINDSIKKFCGIDTDVYGCGRTDAGVHGIAMPAHFDLPDDFGDDKLNCDTIMNAVNYYLTVPNNISVKIIKCERVENDFHARFSCSRRHYVYKVLCRQSLPVLDDGFVCFVRKALNLEDMNQAKDYLIGQHDFTSFRSSQCQSLSPIKTMENIRIVKIENENCLDNSVRYEFYFTAKSFLHHQVRNMMGALLDVGFGRKNPESIKDILHSKDRKNCGATADASGLYFLKADYE